MRWGGPVGAPRQQIRQRIDGCQALVAGPRVVRGWRALSPAGGSGAGRLAQSSGGRIRTMWLMVTGRIGQSAATPEEHG
jgi:hypothetical protein